MLNYIWAFMIIIGIIYGSLTGHMAELSNAALDSAREAVTLCITMLGVMALWVGLMQIAQKAGIIASMTKKLRPFLLFLFPRLRYEDIALEYISTNVVANILGLGWACTPAGLKAMENLAEAEEEKRISGIQAAPAGTATDEMCTFLIINISSLQLIPVNIIAYRVQYGSANPTDVIGPAIAATAVSTGAAVIFCGIMNRKGRAG